jgi:hypothetical protein
MNSTIPASMRDHTCQVLPDELMVTSADACAREGDFILCAHQAVDQLGPEGFGGHGVDCSVKLGDDRWKGTSVKFFHKTSISLKHSAFCM